MRFSVGVICTDTFGSVEASGAVLETATGTEFWSSVAKAEGSAVKGVAINVIVVNAPTNRRRRVSTLSSMNSCYLETCS